MCTRAWAFDLDYVALVAIKFCIHNSSLLYESTWNFWTTFANDFLSLFARFSPKAYVNSHHHPQINGPKVFHILHIIFLEVNTNYVVFKVTPGDLIKQKSCMEPIVSLLTKCQLWCQKAIWHHLDPRVYFILTQMINCSQNLIFSKTFSISSLSFHKSGWKPKS